MVVVVVATVEPNEIVVLTGHVMMRRCRRPLGRGRHEVGQRRSEGGLTFRGRCARRSAGSRVCEEANEGCGDTTGANE